MGGGQESGQLSACEPPCHAAREAYDPVHGISLHEARREEIDRADRDSRMRIAFSP